MLAFSERFSERDDGGPVVARTASGDRRSESGSNRLLWTVGRLVRARQEGGRDELRKTFTTALRRGCQERRAGGWTEFRTTTWVPSTRCAPSPPARRPAPP